MIIPRFKSFVYRKLISYIIRRAHRWEKLYPISRYGNDYGGFFIFDNQLKQKKGNVIVYSFGIGEDLSFSDSIISSMVPEIYAYDPTPKAIDFVNKHKLSNNPHFHFFPYGLSDKDEKVKFYLPSDDFPDISGSAEYYDGLKKVGIDVQMHCLNTIFKKNGHSHVDILKMDIEGTEFKVIENLKKCDADIDQICVEVHHRFFKNGERLFFKLLITMYIRGYILISISDDIQELTFVKRKLKH
ncbi:methyltransferase, FkbM family [Prevotella sp. tc2-28]|uniref:FkbM family methyltransferase n=1 Tax=Prevotella sp. tc2-28 TaxID=1761888 RepID=UPI0008974B48|nr:FkbM family methyltransferase [Prevotella sp. tc2-28]SEA92472.1 methyltransferase, FkbM family [Prevotella sp. tc2-28]